MGTNANRRPIVRMLGFLSAVAALLFWGACVFDMWAVLTNWRPYVDGYGEGLAAWIRDFPLLRKIGWGASIAFGLAGAVTMLWRATYAGDLMLAAVGLLVAGLAYDLVYADGVAHYGRGGLVCSSIVVAVASFLAWAAYARAKVMTVIQLTPQPAE